MNISGWIYLLVCSSSVVAANLMLREGMIASGIVIFDEGFLGLPKQILQLLMQPMLLASFFFYGLAMLIWFRLVATQPISIAYPVLATITFAGISGAGMLFLGEGYSVQKIAGLVFALTGLLLIASA